MSRWAVHEAACGSRGADRNRCVLGWGCAGAGAREGSGVTGWATGARSLELTLTYIYEHVPHDVPRAARFGRSPGAAAAGRRPHATPLTPHRVTAEAPSPRAGAARAHGQAAVRHGMGPRHAAGRRPQCSNVLHTGAAHPELAIRCIYALDSIRRRTVGSQPRHKRTPTSRHACSPSHSVFTVPPLRPQCGRRGTRRIGVEWRTRLQRRCCIDASVLLR